jgi:phosphomannomutase/phosphoglucomutase
METEPEGTLAIAGTPWEIRYWSSPVDSNELLYFAAVLVTILFILGLLSFWMLRKLTGLFTNDVTLLKTLATNTTKGQINNDDYNFKFEIFSELVSHSRLLNIRDISGGKPSMQVELTSQEEEDRKLEERSNVLLDDLDKQSARADALIRDLDDDLDLNVLGGEDIDQPSEMLVSPTTAVDLPISLPLTTGIAGIIGKDFNSDYLRNLGRAFGTELLQAGMTKIVVGIDGSKASDKAMQRLSSGLLTAGCKLLDLKSAAGPVVAFSTHFPKDSVGVVISNSFLPSNACKLKFLYSGGFISAELLERVNARITAKDFIEGLGVSATPDTKPETDYIGAIVEDIHIHCTMKIVVTSASNIITELAADLFKALGCDVIIASVSGESASAGSFDPRNPAHLQQLSKTVLSEHADLGVAYDSEGSGFAVVDSSGHIIWADRLMMVLAVDVLQTFPGADILFDTDGLSALAKTVTQHSGKLLTHNCGEQAFNYLASTNMPLAGNMDGQFVFADRWFQYPDALYASARLLEILSADDSSSQEVFSALPDYVASQPLFSAITETNAHDLLTAWEQKLMQIDNTSILTDNGLRINVAKVGWVVARYDKQQGGLVFRFQAKSEEALQTLMRSFKKLIPKDSTLKLPF